MEKEKNEGKAKKEEKKEKDKKEEKEEDAGFRGPRIPADVLKIFASVTMMVQTFGVNIIETGLMHMDQLTEDELMVLLETDTRMMRLANIEMIMQFIGGMSAPLFAFLLVEGFLHTSKFQMYSRRIIIFALLAELPYDLANSGMLIDSGSQNPLMTMWICLIMLLFLRIVKDKYNGKDPSYFALVAFSLIIILCALFCSILLNGAYAVSMVLLSALFYLLYDRQVIKTVVGIIISLTYISGPLSFYGIWFYSGERKNWLPKYTYYVFYVLQFLVLGVIGRYLL